MKKALFEAWTDNESSSSSSSDGEEHTNTANFCLIAYEDDEVQSLDPLFDFTFDELISTFNDLMSEFKKVENKITKLKVINENLLKEKNKCSNKNDSLRNEFDALSAKYISLEKENEAYINDNKSLSSKNINLKKEIEKLKPIVDKMTLSSNKLELLLINKRDSDHKARIGYNFNNTNGISTRKFVSPKTFTSTSKNKIYKPNLANYKHVKTIISTSKPYAFTSEITRNTFNQMVRTFNYTHTRTAQYFSIKLIYVI